MTRSFLLLALCLVPADVVVEYSLPRAKAFPHDPAVGADGIVWYTDQANSYIGRLDPATGKVTDYATPTRASGGRRQEIGRAHSCTPRTNVSRTPSSA